MRIEISPKRRLEDTLVIWPEAGPDVDIVLDPSTDGLKFRDGSIQVIYAFNILGLTEPDMVFNLVHNLYKLLEPKGELYIIENDFDYINRAYLGGDLSITELNTNFRRKTYLNQEEIIRIMKLAGFVNEKDMRIWFTGLKFERQHFEMVLSAVKNPLK